MRNKLLIGILSIVLFTCIAASALTAAYAWLTPGQPVAFDAKGNAIAGYFYGGTGTKDDPYILASPKHVYNLAWLQYLGTFNVTDENGNLKQFFFELNNDIDMEPSVYRVLPPIGTTRYPFVGNFNGNGYSISNAIVANIIDPDNNQISEFPPAVLQEGSDRQNALQNVEIVGFFGVIGEYEEGSLGFTLTDAQLEDLGVKDLLLKNVVVQTSTDKSLAGLVAGFVNGNLENVYVSSGTITARPDATTLRDDNVLSSYSLIGNYETTKINWIGGPSSTVGQGKGWGGYVDMLTLAMRITYMFGANTNTSTMVGDQIAPNATVRDTYHIYGQTMGSDPFSYKNDYYFSISEGTYLPLNIDNRKGQVSQEHYTALKAEELYNNTGFVVGFGDPTVQYDSGTKKLPRTQIWSTHIGKLYYSLGGDYVSSSLQSSKFNNYKTFTYDENSVLQILTKDINGKYYVIGDTYNNLTSTSSHSYTHDTQHNSNASIALWNSTELNLQQYLTGAKVRDKLDILLNDKIENDNDNRLCTLKLNFDVDEDKPLTYAASVNLGSQSVSSLVQGSVHFALEESGIITMVVATISNTAATAPSAYITAYLPKLYRVNRNGSGTITDLDLIETIYQKNGQYYYNSDPGNAVCVFDYSKMGSLSCTSTGTNIYQYANSLFYFEIPVDAGEFVLAGKSCAHLLYLDIGANAGDSSTPPSSGGVADPTGKLTGVYFVDANGNPILQNVETDGTKPAVAFEIKLKNTGVSVSFEGTGTGVNVAITPTDDAEVKLVTATTKQVKMKKEEETTGP